MKKRLAAFAGTVRRFVLLLTGGRPMTDCGFAFHDLVSGKAVRYYEDGFGRRWLADNGPWSGFRVEQNAGAHTRSEAE